MRRKRQPFGGTLGGSIDAKTLVQRCAWHATFRIANPRSAAGQKRPYAEFGARTAGCTGWQQRTNDQACHSVPASLAIVQQIRQPVKIILGEMTRQASRRRRSRSLGSRQLCQASRVLPGILSPKQNGHPLPDGRVRACAIKWVARAECVSEA
jgi:hypothetical protein